MGRKIDCPFVEGAYIVLPDEWLGEHVQRRDQARKNAEKLDSPTLETFAVSMALLEDWHGLPGLEGNPDKWDFAKVKIQVIAWVLGVVMSDFNAAWEVPKNS